MYYVGHMGLFGGLWMVLFWVAFIWLVVWLVRQKDKSLEEPIQILKNRYAKGEITKKQFEDMKKNI